ncbi:hypothetical protein [Janthinobacterium sp. HLX7-2]|uniref:hypothetical protein n=1 Tax=Janthinobacterium sp. HLX7-2 TaxID=1259331 RepID=UPI003F235746
MVSPSISRVISALPAPERSCGGRHSYGDQSAGAAMQPHLPKISLTSADFRFLGNTLKRKISIVNKKKVSPQIIFKIIKKMPFYLSFCHYFSFYAFAIVVWQIHANGKKVASWRESTEQSGENCRTARLSHLFFFRFSFVSDISKCKIFTL